MRLAESGEVHWGLVVLAHFLWGGSARLLRRSIDLHNRVLFTICCTPARGGYAGVNYVLPALEQGDPAG
jgi:hypothetical protein